MGLFDALSTLGDILGDDEEFNPDFRVRNRTGYDIHELYVSESNSDDWEEDVLGDEILEDGDSTEVEFDTNSRHRYWDIRIVDEEDDEAVFEHIDLSRTSRVTLYYDDDGDPCADCD